MVAVLFEPP